MTEAATILDGWNHWDCKPIKGGWLVAFIQGAVPAAGVKINGARLHLSEDLCVAGFDHGPTQNPHKN